MLKSSNLVAVDLSLFGVFWVMWSSLREALLSSLGSFVGNKQKKGLKVAPLYLFWII